MKHLLHSTAFLLLLLLGLSARSARASHAQGGDLRYESLGNNQYRVTLRYFRDCSGITAETTHTLNVRVGTPTTSCNSTNPLNTTVTLLRQGPTLFGNQYCATVGGICTNNGPANYEENIYVGTVTLPAQQWTLSVEASARPAIVNIGGNTTIRFEAYLDNRLTSLNSAPNFGTSPAVFVGWKQNVTLNMGAFDAEGDSLVYSLVTPLEGCNTLSTYQPYPGMGTTPTVISTNPPCILTPPTTPQPALFSATNPIALRVDTTGSCPVRQAVPGTLSFNPANGSISFSPGVYNATAPSSAGLNKYAVAVKVDEYRPFNGVYQLIGTTRRELFITVYDCGINTNPRFANTVRVYGQSTPQPLTQVIPVRSGSATSLIITASDANAGQSLTLTANHLNIPGVYVQQLTSGSMALEFTPPASLPDGTYYVTVKAEDDNCPVKGFEMQTLAFRVSGSPLSSRAKANQMLASAYPNPFADQVRFALPRPAGHPAAAVEVTDQLGRLVERLPAAPAAGTAEAQLQWRPKPGTPAGVYLARFPDGQHTVRLLYQPQ
jgi:hypothetical protein